MPTTSKDREIIEKLSNRTLTDQEVFEGRQDLLGAFDWLLEMDRKYNPELYKDD